MLPSHPRCISSHSQRGPPPPPVAFYVSIPCDRPRHCTPRRYLSPTSLHLTPQGLKLVYDKANMVLRASGSISMNK